MADTVDTATFLSPAGEFEEPADAPAASEDKAEGRKEGTDEHEEARSVTELAEQLGRDLSGFGVAEAQLEAARNLPEVRRTARDVVGALVVVVAALTAFVFVNVAAVAGLSTVMATWLAALVLAAVWMAVGGVLLFGIMGRARRWLLWIVVKSPPTEAMEELERERDAAGKDALKTLELLGPALAAQIALAAVPDAADVAGGVVEVGASVLEGSDEIVEVITEELPGGGVVSQVWDVALKPGRLGVKVVTTVLRRGRPTA